MYQCAICGKTHHTIEERHACETECLKKRKEDEVKVAQEKKRKEKLSSEKTINEELDKLDKMVKEHLRKYEYFSVYNNYPYLSTIFKNSAFWF